MFKNYDLVGNVIPTNEIKSEDSIVSDLEKMLVLSEKSRKSKKVKLKKLIKALLLILEKSKNRQIKFAIAKIKGKVNI